MTSHTVLFPSCTLQASNRQRRGNTLVLVAAILALLVIIATSYITRAQSQRGTAQASLASAQRVDNAEVIAEMVAQELADALFVWPVDVNGDSSIIWQQNIGAFEGMADPNFPRLRPDANATRYGVDRRELFSVPENRMVWATIPYSRAPYHTVPYTNPPDFVDGSSSLDIFAPRLLPAGPGNQYFVSGQDQAGDGGVASGAPNSNIAAWLSTEDNPLGFPGFNDSRWLRDTEPVRWDTGQFANGFTPGELDAFSHWRKLSYIGRPNNGWRIVFDIADVDDSVVYNLAIPVEQWLTRRPTYPGAGAFAPLNPVTGNVNVNFLVNNDPSNGNNLFWRQWRSWFGFPSLAGPNFNYADLYHGGGTGLNPGIPPNLYRLNDLNADGTFHNYFLGGVLQDSPEAEFVPGTARNMVSRVLTDTTGDGYTDSFWWVSPAPARNGIRQIVGVSITDNSARLNANVATRFQRNDPSGASWVRTKTRGFWPTDLALVGELDPDGGDDTWNVGFFDNRSNWSPPGINDGVNFAVEYNRYRWNRHLAETGLPYTGNPNTLPHTQRLTEEDRWDYWQRSARWGLAYVPGSAYTPFTLEDEVELRMFEGNNHPWIYSRLEHSTQDTATNPSFGFLRAGPYDRQESSEYLMQVNNRELVRDSRRKLTLYSGARNDQTAPEMWWMERYEYEPAVVQMLSTTLGYDRDTVEGNFEEHSRRKLDLREPELWYHDYDGDGRPRYQAPYLDTDAGRLNFRDRLAPSLLMALTDGPDRLVAGTTYRSYYGNYTSTAYSSGNSALTRTRRLAAGFASNILAYRSNLRPTLADAVYVPEFGSPGEMDGSGNLPDAENYIPAGQVAVSGSTLDDVAHIGMSPQPFLVEAFVAHVYRRADEVPRYHVPDELAVQLDAFGIEWSCNEVVIPPGFEDLIDIDLLVEYSNRFDGIFLDDEEHRSTIIVVQIANPFDVPLDLWDYQIKAFGNAVLDLRTMIPPDSDARWLPPATDEHPRTAIFYAMKDSIFDTPNFSEKWRDFLDIDFLGDTSAIAIVGDVSTSVEKLPHGTRVFNVGPTGLGGWSVNDRTLYDDAEQGISILQRYDDGNGTDEWVVVDRMDHQYGTTPAECFDCSFLHAVRLMGTYKPMDRPEPLCSVPPFDRDDDRYPAYYLEPDSNGILANRHMVQWVRATRAWGVDVNGNGIYESHESNPRYVFGDRTVVVPTDAATPAYSGDLAFFRPRSAFNGTFQELAAGEEDDGSVVLAGPNSYNFDDDPNQDVGNDRTVPWFARAYYDAYGRYRAADPGAGTADFARKPTFFDLNHREDPRFVLFDERSYPDKGWYGQYNIKPHPLDPTINIVSVGGHHALSGFTTNRNLRVNGVDDQPDFNAPVPYRHGFAMQMAMKNKMRPPDPYTLPPNVNANVFDANRDFEQVGELLNVWLFGHELVLGGLGTTTTRTTFAEFMSARNRGLTGEGVRINRLQLEPDILPMLEYSGTGSQGPIGQVLNNPQRPGSHTNPTVLNRYRSDARHAWPAVPAGARVLDLFVCDGPGRDPFDVTGDNVVDERDYELLRFYNANEFAGRMTPGLININTATPEVLRTLPHMTRIVHEITFNGTGGVNPLDNPYPLIAEAMVRYRDRVGAPVNIVGQPLDYGPSYAHRGRHQDFFADPVAGDNQIDKFIPGLRGDRGFASIGELGLLTRSGRVDKDFVVGNPDEFVYPTQLSAGDAYTAIDQNSRWRIDYPLMPERHVYREQYPNQFQFGAAGDPYAFLYPRETTYSAPNFPNVPLTAGSTRIGTALVDVYDEDMMAEGWQWETRPAGFRGSIIAEDATEANVLLAGISNLVTTRSDTFTVHLRIRSFRQNLTTGVWDATDPEYIVDDARYVMLVDRSNVNKPSDKPKILYLERLPY